MNKSPSEARFQNFAFLGEAMVEYFSGELNTKNRFAGDVLNSAIYLKRLLGDSADISMCTLIGQSGISRNFLDFLGNESIDTSLIMEHPSRDLGKYTITVSQSGERSFSYDRDHSAARELFGAYVPLGLVGKEFIFLTAISVAILPEDARQNLWDFLVTFREKGGWIGFDSNFRPKLWNSRKSAQYWIDKFWRISDISLPSLDDELAIFGEFDQAEVLARFKNYPVKYGALKRGENGPLAIAPQITGALHFSPATKVIDTTAAGDSFNAGFLASISKGEDIQTAMKVGHELSLKVIAQKGAIIELNSHVE